MRVLICTFTYSPNRDGVATACETLAVGLHGLGHEISVAVGREGGVGNAYEKINDVPVFSFAVANLPKADRTPDYRAFQAWVLAHETDIIITQCLDAWTTSALLEVAPRLESPLLLVSHGYSEHLLHWSPYFAWGIGAWLRKIPTVFSWPFRFRRFAWVTFLSNSADFGRFFDLLLARATGFKRWSIVPNGVDPARFTRSGDPFLSTFAVEEETIFLCVANYSTRKNQEFALRAYRRAQIANSALVFIGSELGAYGTVLQALNQKLSLEHPVGRVLFLEKVSQDLTADAYGACTAFVLSAQAETQPIVLLEAMAAGKPWISTATGCVAQLKGGLVVRDEAGMSEAMQLLATQPDLRQRLAAAGQAASKDSYTRDAYVQRYHALITSLVSGSGIQPI